MLITTCMNSKYTFPLSSVRHGAPRQFVAGGPRWTVANREVIRVRVYILQAVLGTRPGLGQKVITVCPGYATVCGYTFTVKPRWRDGVPRCVPISHLGGRAGFFTPTRGKGLQSPGVTRKHMQICMPTNVHETYNRYVICKVQNASYIPWQKRTAIRVGEKMMA